MKLTMNLKNNNKTGFTLIELSIVLVIIGLIVGGIVVGQAMIRTSEIRSAVTQLEKYSSAVNTFRNKFNGLPGDLKNAYSFGFDSGRNGAFSGNGAIESGAATSASFREETSCFWDDLNYAGLIDESLDQDASCEQAQSPAELGNSIPRSDVGQSNYLIIGSIYGVNYWWLTGVNSITTGTYSITDNLTASAAYEIDTKMDDGLYDAGSVQAYNGATAGELFATADTVAAAGPNVCIIATGYNFTTDGGSDTGCQLRIKPQF